MLEQLRRASPSPGRSGHAADPPGARVVGRQQLRAPRLRVGLGHDAARTRAHVEDLVHLVVGDPAELRISPKTGGTGERVVDLVADVAREPQEVVEAVAGDVREAADLGLGREQLEHGADVDLGRLEQHVAERAAEPLVFERDVGEDPAGERVAVRVEAGGGKADQGVARLDPLAGDDRVERDQADRARRRAPSP